MANTLTAEDLLKNKPHEPATLTFSDGLTAILLPETRYFITSPNRTRIPLPPLGSTRDLYLREDGFYGHDDYVQYPQPFNPRYAYLACMPTNPILESDPYHEDLCMWERGFHPSLFTYRDNLAMGRFRESIKRLRDREQQFLGANPRWKPRLAELELTIDLCLHRLSNFSLTARKVTRTVTELQRAWRTAVSIIDFVQLYEPEMMATSELSGSEVSEGAPLIPGSRMGAFVWKPRDALMLFRAKLPVYYVRNFNEFNPQIRILEVSSPKSLPITLTASSPVDPIIYTGQAGSDDKIVAIRVASISCFDSGSPFENLHLPEAYQSSYSLASGSIISATASQPLTSKEPSSGPSRSSKSTSRKPKKAGKAVQIPQATRDLFADLPSENMFIGPPILAWKDANKSIDQDHPAKRQMLPGDNPRLKTVLPDPAIIVSDSKRQTDYLNQWAHIREPFLRRSQFSGGDEIPIPLRSSVWRKVLSVPFHGIYEGSNTSDKQARWHKEATEWLQKLFKKYAPGVDLIAPPDTMLDPARGRQLIHELSVLNFWYQLMSLDEIADTTAIAGDSATATKADILVDKARHRRHRLRIMHKVLGGNDDPFEFTFSSRNIDLASESWATRLPALKAFWELMNTWPGTKPLLWSRGNDENLAQMPQEGFRWEKELVHFYVQTYYNFLGYPPVLPRRK
ncbi:hypothetical protein AAF712_010186 [Marasmius tenuissimus]|uniref:Uncharacterized protein n=1 Tax=Marasmius tenuissimus TaxID=585030 RepID=A0ABR2ZPI6_9AGAR